MEIVKESEYSNKYICEDGTYILVEYDVHLKGFNHDNSIKVDYAVSHYNFSGKKTSYISIRDYTLFFEHVTCPQELSKMISVALRINQNTYIESIYRDSRSNGAYESLFVKSLNNDVYLYFYKEKNSVGYSIESNLAKDD